MHQPSPPLIFDRSLRSKKPCTSFGKSLHWTSKFFMLIWVFLRNFHNFFFFCFMHNFFTGIFTTIIVYCKVVLRLYKHSCNLFSPVTDDEHGGVWNMPHNIRNVLIFLKVISSLLILRLNEYFTFSALMRNTGRKWRQL